MTYTLDDAKREAVRQSERHLEAQQRLSMAADQRALAFCSAVIVISVLLLENIGSSERFTIDFVVLGVFIVSSILAAYSAKPTRFYGSGGSASGIEPYLNDHHCGSLMGAISRRNDEYICKNDKAIRRSAWTFRIALLIGFLGLILLFVSESGILDSIWGQQKEIT